MNESIIVAVISLCGVIISSAVGAVTASKLTAFKIEELTKKVEKHNSLIERTYRIEQDVAVIHTELENLHEQITENRKGD